MELFPKKTGAVYLLLKKPDCGCLAMEIFEDFEKMENDFSKEK